MTFGPHDNHENHEWRLREIVAVGILAALMMGFIPLCLICCAMRRVRLSLGRTIHRVTDWSQR